MHNTILYDGARARTDALEAFVGWGRQRGLPHHRFTRPVLGHAVQVDRLSVGHDVLVLGVVNVTVGFVAGLRLLYRGRPSALLLLLLRCGQRPPVRIARYARLVRVLALDAFRVYVTVLASGHTVHADGLLLERAVIVLETPSDATVRVVVSVSPQHLKHIGKNYYIL